MGKQRRQELSSYARENARYLKWEWSQGQYVQAFDFNHNLVGQGSFELMTKTYPLALKPPFPANPSRRARYVIKFHRNDKTLIESFSETYAAVKYLDAVIRDDKVKWLNHSILRVRDVEVQCDQLEDILDHELSDLEDEWTLPEPHPNNIARFLNDKPAPKIERKAPPPPRGEVTIAVICEQLEIEPRIARAILRKKKIPKPASGWSWSEEEADDIAKVIMKGLK